MVQLNYHGKTEGSLQQNAISKLNGKNVAGVAQTQTLFQKLQCVKILGICARGLDVKQANFGGAHEHFVVEKLCLNYDVATEMK